MPQINLFKNTPQLLQKTWVILIAMRNLMAYKTMKSKSLIIIAGMLALSGISYSEEVQKPSTGIPEKLLKKYDTDKDGLLSKEEQDVMNKDKALKEAKVAKEPKAPKIPVAPKEPKAPKEAKAPKEPEAPKEPKPEKPAE